ncbi:MAG TPA: MBL fold metallo-hydrolase [Pyrinomonadaceae bacterium]|jgi:phosphoribosyl 1,2-cyclic phosphodiesterase|nr:MBL fold metallo-hydrolase [Chloracidobacterium sp.]MBP9934128.1 MBL fold metallo-hydrolase [Pyrinomonadaceae bacterium]MBK7801672.1 MBL fold metallo-hydrolase [Chloracidobacterium sp.]MBK9436989.1 MBL fold metallo-hydrolase [Chloracidobacterium sp.]MBK9768150.1 MBL fold metallo-hydrolase [Chloracidobacterium sp.]
MRFTVLGSGSTGNAVLISSDKTNVLVDAGMSSREILRRLAEVGVSHDSLDGVLITHEHGDHAGGLRVLMASVNCPVFMSKATEDAYYDTRAGGQNGDSESSKRKAALNNKTVEIESTRDFRIGDIDFEPFSVPHDAADNFGFVARKDGVRVATLMDFGHITDLVKEKLKGCDAIVVESNHSRDMLRACSVYTWDLKQRIMSRTGHLSNEDLAEWLQNEFDGSARYIVLAHLSQRANDPHLARLMAESAIQMRSPLFKAETKITISQPKQPTDWFQF